MNLGLVLGGVASGAMDAYNTQQTNARANQAAADAHTQQLRIQAEQHAMDMASATTDNAATQASTAADQATASAGAIPTPGSAIGPGVTIGTSSPALPADTTTPISPPVAAIPATPAAPAPPPAPADSASTPIGGVVPDAAPAPAPPLQPYAQASNTGTIARQIRAAGASRHIDPRIVEATVAGGQAESGLNPATSPNGSSTGLFQFHPQTFAGLGGTDITNTGQQINAGLSSFSAADQALTKTLGHTPTASELYLYHQQGPAGAKALLTADPGKSAAQALVDAGVYKDPTIARKAINGNMPHPTGVKPIQDPTVGQFVGAWDNRINKMMSGGAKASSALPATAGAAAPVVPEFASSATPSVYEAPDGSGPMVTYSPQRATTDTAADQVARRQAAIERQYGNTAAAEEIENGIVDRQAKNQALNAGDLQAKQAASMDTLARVSSVDDIPAAYRTLSTSQHVTATQDPDSTVHVNVFNNGSNKLVAKDSFSPLMNDDGTMKMTGMQVFKWKTAAMLKDPATFGATMDAHGDMVAQTEKNHADAALASSSAARNTADITAGVPAATAASLTGSGADSASHAAAQNFETQTKQKIQALSIQAAAEPDPDKRGQIQTQIAGLTGQLQPTHEPITYQGQQTTLNTYGNGLQTVTDPRSGAEYKYGDEPVVQATLAKAAKLNVPLTYGMERDAEGNVHPLYRIAGVKGASENAADMFAAYEAQKKAQAIPTPTDPDAYHAAIGAVAPTPTGLTMSSAFGGQ